MAYGCDSAQGSPLIPVDEAIQQMLQEALPINRIEKVSLKEALERTLAENIHSAIDVPPSDNSAMDGYVVRYADLHPGGDTLLLLSQRICAGDVGEALQAGTAARIFTGAPIPPNADTVIMQEYCLVEGDHVRIQITPEQGSNIRSAGEDIHCGDTILKLGQTLRPQDLGLAASVGVAELEVFQRLTVAIFFTGDELCTPGEPLQAGQIYNSNRYTLHALLQSIGCKVIDLGIVKDSLEDTKATMRKAAEQADLVMTSGGVSVGEEDYVRLALEAVGQLKLWRINIKPGKPLAFGRIGKTPFLGMPGNPVSVFATFCIMARPFLRKQQGKTNVQALSITVPAGFERKKAGSREEYVRARLENDDSENSQLTLYSHQGSGVLTSTNWADGLVCIPSNNVVKRGDKLKFYSFSELFSA